MQRYLCVIDVLSSGHLAALEITADDALAAERIALRTGAERFGDVEILDIVRDPQAAA
jgi:hypothetical protein